ncbi:MAG TPA: superoxide dismutase family protein [Oculatellaceae cyanobacterium]
MNFIQKTIKITAIAFFLSVLTLVYGCQPEATLTDNQTPAAKAAIKSTSDPSKVIGEVSFSNTSGGMLVEAKINDAPPGKHGFHIHEVGNCGDKGNAAKGHFNPDKVKHGFVPKDGFKNAHAGDLGNITISSDGKGTLSETVPGLTLSGSKYAINSLSVILHEKVDDFGQPLGNAGGRIGCGIITTNGA